MACISIPTAALIGGGLTAASGVASGLIGASASGKAAALQKQAADKASADTMKMFNITQTNLQPFIGAGTAAMGQLQSLTGAYGGGNPLTAPLTAPFKPTMDQLAQTPGYQFSLDQGLKATQNGFAAQGLASSGAAMKGAANYAEGLAGTTYQQQFTNYLAQQQQIYNMLGGITSTGANAAATAGNQGLGYQSTANALTVGGANAQAAGTIGSANAIANGLSSAAGGGSTAALILAMNNAGMFAGAGK